MSTYTGKKIPTILVYIVYKNNVPYKKIEYDILAAYPPNVGMITEEDYAVYSDNQIINRIQLIELALDKCENYNGYIEPIILEDTNEECVPSTRCEGEWTNYVCRIIGYMTIGDEQVPIYSNSKGALTYTYRVYEDDVLISEDTWDIITLLGITVLDWQKYSNNQMIVARAKVLELAGVVLCKDYEELGSIFKAADDCEKIPNLTAYWSDKVCRLAADGSVTGECYYTKLNYSYDY